MLCATAAPSRLLAARRTDEVENRMMYLWNVKLAVEGKNEIMECVAASMFTPHPLDHFSCQVVERDNFKSRGSSAIGLA